MAYINTHRQKKLTQFCTHLVRRTLTTNVQCVREHATSRQVDLESPMQTKTHAFTPFSELLFDLPIVCSTLVSLGRVYYSTVHNNTCYSIQFVSSIHRITRVQMRIEFNV